MSLPANARRTFFTALLLTSTLWAAPPQDDGAEPAATGFDALQGEGLAWREIGPYRGGRSAAATGIPQDRQTYYMGACGGGVWKTDDAGKSWKCVSDGAFGGSIGSVAVSSWDPNVVYVGGGEVTMRGNVSHGDGVWRSLDAGRNWEHVGLADSRHIPRMVIHPTDPQRVYAAVLGHLHGPNEERGVYRSLDGGESWQPVLQVSPEVGCVDVVMDPTNPRILYACFWRVKRTPYSLDSGGDGSGIWKSTDGGDSWTELTENEGLPEGPLGINGLTVSPSDPDNLYAIIEAEKGGVFRSRDAGETWKKVNSERKLRQRAWYYTRVVADPADADSLYVLNVGFHRSKDGGKSFESIRVPHGDNHDLWIDPADPLRMIEANDGGANITFDGGLTWSTQENQPTAQMYRVSTDNAFPYRLLGGQQDNSTVRIPSRNLNGGSIDERSWSSTAGGESGHVIARTDDPERVFGGSYDGFLTFRNHATGERRNVHVWPDNPMGWGAEELKYRFQWNFPIFTSPHDADALYVAANVLFRSHDEGGSWEVLSPDLTRNDKSRQGSSGGPITQDNTSVEYYCTIFAAFESPHEAGVLWCGSDDGVVHLSRNDGKTWLSVTPPDLPEWAMVNSLEPHPTEPGGCYLAATRYKLDDFQPLLFATLDYGATWRRCDEGIPRDHFTRVLRADPDRAGLLYAGTERGVYASFDDGDSWSSLQLELPIVPVTDLALKEGDLVAATQGRGFWILDNLSPLHQLDLDAIPDQNVLFDPRPSLRLGGGRGRGSSGRAGSNPAGGVWIHYHLAELDEETEVRLEILEEDGDLVRTFVPKSKAKGADAMEVGGLSREAGLQRFVWNLTYAGAADFPKMILWSGGMGGPRAVPGTYTARLTVGDQIMETAFELLPDPRSSASQEDLVRQHERIAAICVTLTNAHQGIRDLRGIRADLKTLAGKCGEEREDEGPFAALLDEIANAQEILTSVEEALYQTQNESAQDPLNFPVRLTDKLAGVKGSIATGDFAPTRQAEAVAAELTGAIEAELARLQEVRAVRLASINAGANALAIPAVQAEAKEEETDEED